jgi:tetratricopeptide (TPR) repeat protein
MDAVTYPDSGVIDFFDKNLIPVKVLFDAKPLSDDFKIKWTPTLIAVDHDGEEHHRSMGYLPPEDLIASMLLGIGKLHFDKGEFSEAVTCFEQIPTSYGKSDSAAEAVYMLGVTKYKASQDPKSLREAYDMLVAEYPGSEWTKKAKPYSLIE